MRKTKKIYIWKCNKCDFKTLSDDEAAHHDNTLFYWGHETKLKTIRVSIPFNPYEFIKKVEKL